MAAEGGGAGSIDRLVVARAAAYGALLGVPAAFAQGVLLDQDPKPVGAVNVSALLVFVGFFVAGWAAGKGTAAQGIGQGGKHGACAALVTFVPVELIAVLGRLDRDVGVSLFAIIITGLFAAVAGTVGGQFGASRRKGDAT